MTKSNGKSSPLSMNNEYHNHLKIQHYRDKIFKYKQMTNKHECGIIYFEIRGGCHENQDEAENRTWLNGPQAFSFSP